MKVVFEVYTPLGDGVIWKNSTHRFEADARRNADEIGPDAIIVKVTRERLVRG